MRRIMSGRCVRRLAGSAFAQDYDLLLKGGHVIDARNKLSAVRDVAIKDGKIAAVAANIPAARALKTVDVTGLYVTPGLIDLHAHVYRPTVRSGIPRRQQRGVSRRIQLPRRRDDVRRSRRLGMAQLRGHEGQGDRSLEDARPRLHQHRRAAAAPAASTNRTSPTWK